MSRGPLLLDREKDTSMTKEELLDELTEMRRQIAAFKEGHAEYERVKKERQEPERITIMLNEIPDSVLIMDNRGQLIYVNSAAEHLFNVSREKVIGKSIWDVYPKKEGTLFYNVYTKTVANRKPTSFREKYRLIGKLLDVSLYPTTSGMTMIFRDITTSWHKEEIQRLALIMLHHLKESIFLMRADGRLFHTNDETRDSLGYSNEELAKMNIFELVPQALASDWHDALNRIKQKGSMTFESRLKTKDCGEFPVEVYANYIQLYGHDYYTISARNITERKKAEETRAFLSSIVQSTDDAIIGKTREGVITSWNYGATKLYGYTAAEAIGENISIIAPPDKADVLTKINEKIGNGEVVEHIETFRKRKDGKLIEVSLTASPIYDTSGRITGLSTISRDITERKRVENAAAEARSRAEMYVDLMGHDINNMNMVAIGNLEMANMELEQHGKIDKNGKPLIEKSLESLKSSTDLIKNVQKLQRTSAETLKLKSIDVGGVLDSVIGEYRPTHGRDVAINFVRKQTCHANADELLRDLFVNLISNAIKHSSPERSLTISIIMDSVDDGGKKYCRTIIEDNGPGIQDETKSTLFKRYVRGKTKAKGSGLGLYLVRTLVDHYRGHIKVEDRVPGDYTQGARFVVMIPAAG